MSIKFEKPLIGIEWEPQVSLQKYPNRKVNIEWGIDSSIRVMPHKKNEVYIMIPHSLRGMLKTKNIYVDVNNMEIYTDPVPINRLNTEIAHRYKILKEFWVLVAQHIQQMIGVFLPASNQEPCVTKHINMSYAVKPKVAARLITEYARSKRKNPYELKVNIKKVVSTYHKERIHLTVPYNFMHYEALYKSYLKAYHRDLLWQIFNEGKKVYANSATRAYLRNEDNQIISWLKDLKGWLLEYSQDHPMNEPILLGIATPDRFIEKHKLI